MVDCQACDRLSHLAWGRLLCRPCSYICGASADAQVSVCDSGQDPQTLPSLRETQTPNVGGSAPAAQRHSDRKSGRGKRRRNLKIAGTKPECYRKQRTGRRRGRCKRTGAGVPPAVARASCPCRFTAKMAVPRGARRRLAPAPRRIVAHAETGAADLSHSSIWSWLTAPAC
jgi:hypothetical protein